MLDRTTFLACKSNLNLQKTGNPDLHQHASCQHAHPSRLAREPSLLPAQVHTRVHDIHRATSPTSARTQQGPQASPTEGNHAATPRQLRHAQTRDMYTPARTTLRTHCERLARLGHITKARST